MCMVCMVCIGHFPTASCSLAGLWFDPGTCYPSDLHSKIWCCCIFSASSVHLASRFGRAHLCLFVYLYSCIFVYRISSSTLSRTQGKGSWYQSQANPAPNDNYPRGQGAYVGSPFTPSFLLHCVTIGPSLPSLVQ